MRDLGGMLVNKALEKSGQQMRRRSGSGHELQRFEDKTLSEWDGRWQHIGTLATAKLSQLSSSIGVYRALLEGKVVYVGRAIERHNGGFRKRLRDYTRKSESGRKHRSGQRMHDNANLLEIEVLRTKSVATAKVLEKHFIAKYRPSWNVRL